MEVVVLIRWWQKQIDMLAQQKFLSANAKKNVGHLLANVSVGVNRLVEKAATVNQC